MVVNFYFPVTFTLVQKVIEFILKKKIHLGSSLELMLNLIPMFSVTFPVVVNMKSTLLPTMKPVTDYHLIRLRLKLMVQVYLQEEINFDQMITKKIFDQYFIHY